MEGEEEENSKMEPTSNSPLPEAGISAVTNAECVLGSSESQCEMQTEPLQGGDFGMLSSRDEVEHHKPLGDSGVRSGVGREKVGEGRGTIGGEVIEEENVAEGDELDIASGETEVKPVLVAEIASELQKASDLTVLETEMPPRYGGNDGAGVIGEPEQPAVVVTEAESPTTGKSARLDETSGDLDAGIDVAERLGEKIEAADMALSGGDNVVEEVKSDSVVEGVQKGREESSEVPAHVAGDAGHSECDKRVEDLRENVRDNWVAQEMKDKIVDDTMDNQMVEEMKKGDVVDKAADINMGISSGIENDVEVAENVVVDGDSGIKKEKESQEEACEGVEHSRENVRDKWVVGGVKDRMVGDATGDQMMEETRKGGVDDKAADIGIGSGKENDVEVAENAARDVSVDGSSEVKKEKEFQEEACGNTAAKTVVEDTMGTDAKPYNEAGDVREDTEAMEDKSIHEEMNVGEDTDAVEEMEIAEDVDVGDEEKMEEGSKSGGTKRKRGRPKAVKKKMEEDVCFICFDGGELVLCDRRGCPKAYHPSCVNRDEAFFQTKGRWNCGWHICSSCEKTAHYMCLTCTFSLCKACTKHSVILCVRGNKGFCETCMRTIMMIENNGLESKDMVKVDFDDKSSWEFLFKDYYTDLKEQLSLTTEEVLQAKCPWKESDTHTGKQESRADLDDEEGSDSDNSFGSPKASLPKRRQNRKRSRSDTKDSDPPKRSTLVEARKGSRDNDSEWASKELLEFVMHMKNGDSSVLSQFDVQALLLEYIKTNKLRDPRRKSQIICDSRLQSLFGKPRVGHFEMLKLLESHFLIKEDADDLQGSVVDSDANQLDVDGNYDASGKSSKDRKRKMRKKGDERGFQSNVDDYAAIDNHNIGLLYLRRNLMEDLLEDSGTFHDKVVGSFVRIRISGSNQKQDLYRLVPVIGTSQATEPYKVGKRMTNYQLEILNLNKTEVISIDIISNQDFTEDECERLRQSIKCGLINRLTVGGIQEKAAALQVVRVKDWLETEMARLSHLRDRASDLGRRKELRECVEKLQLLKTPEERQRRLEEIPEIHADPKMDPGYESDDNEVERDDKRRDTNVSSRASAFSGRVREPVSPLKGGATLSDSWGGIRTPSTPHRELSRNLSNKRLPMRDTDLTSAGEIVNESSWSHGAKEEMQHPSSWEKQKLPPTSEITLRSSNPGPALTSESLSRVDPEIRPTAIGAAQSVAKINETEKIWHYKDPSGKIQGPFSMVQLRKWNTTGYFPADLRIWKATEKQEDSTLLIDALNGKFLKDTPRVDVRAQMFSPHLPQQGLESQGVMKSNQSSGTPGLHPEGSSSMGRAKPAPVDVPQLPSDRWGSSTNLPSPTPAQTMSGGMKGHTDENRWPSGGFIPSTNPVPAGGGGAQPLSLLNPDSSSVSQLAGSTSVHHLHSQSAVPADSHRVQSDTRFPLTSDVSKISGVAAMQNIGPALQQLVQAVVNQNPAVSTSSWASGQKTEVTLKSEPSSISVQPSTHGQWGEVPSSVNTSTFNTANLGAFVNPWRPSGSSDQSNVQSSSSFNIAWGSGNSNNIAAAPTPGLDNRGTGWVQMPGNPAVGWAGTVSGNTNVNWVAPGSANASWATPGQAQAPGNPLPGWAPSGQGAVHGNVNTGFVTPGQGPVPNASASWADSANQRAWATEQNQNGDRHSGQRDRGSGGGDSGYGGRKAWNRQSSFGSGGGGSSRSSSKDRGICNYHKNGFCKKGASCNFRHI